MPSAPDVQLLHRKLFEELVEKAKASPRLRINHNFHASMDENPHRFLNVLVRNTYIAPHRHFDPPKSESFVVLEGEIAFYTFNDAGEIATITLLGTDPAGIDIQPGVWHTMAVISDHAVCFEVKPGPYFAANDKDFAPWAPREGDPAAPEYLRRLLATNKSAS